MEVAVRSTMMDLPLTVTAIMRHGTGRYGGREVVTCTEDGTRRQTYADTGMRAARLANALRTLGVDTDQRVATLMWNNAEHLEAYLAIPSMGAVLHTLNLRLDPGQLAYIANHAADDVVICDDTLVPLLAQVLPMFHANAWGLAYAAVMSGADLIMPDRFLQPEPLARLIEAERPTLAGAVPTIWNGLLQHVRAHGDDLSSLRMVPCGGSAVPRSLMEAFEKELGVLIVQACGMTETSPIGSVAHPPAGTPADEAWHYRDTQGRLVCAVEARLVGDNGVVLPHDGTAVGEVEVRGPWVTGAYYKDDDP